NPAGRPEGTRNHATILAERLLQTDIEDVCKAVVTAAKNGNMTASKIIIDRLVRLRKGRPVTFALPDIKGAPDIANAFSLVGQAMAAGELTPDEASIVGTVLEGHRKVLEMCEFEKRLQKLEGKIK